MEPAGAEWKRQNGIPFPSRRRQFSIRDSNNQNTVSQDGIAWLQCRRLGTWPYLVACISQILAYNGGLVKPRTALASQTVNLGWASLAWLPCCMRSLHGLRRLYGQGRRSRGWLPVSASGTRAAAVGCPLASMHVPTVFSDLEFVSPICVCSRSAADPFTFSFLTEPPSPS
ncbi:hypothetical protein LIA77_04515 [Sarocladium implicatum]|nr:hypothetical protein LIA77_04515 [Sarocladium implicatum]